MARPEDGHGQLRLACCPDEAGDLERFAAEIQERHREKGSIRNTIDDVRRVFRILARLGLTTVAELADPDLDRRFVEWTASPSLGWAESTRHKLRKHLHSIIRTAYELGRLRSRPMLPPLRKPGGRWWQEHHPTTQILAPAPALVGRLVDSLRAWLQARENPRSILRLHALVMILLETGIPLAAAGRLAPGDISLFLHHRIRYFPRFALRARQAAISPCLEAALREWLPHCGPRWLFPGRTWDIPWLQSSGVSGAPHRELRAFCRAAGIKPPITFEQLRRFHAEHGPGGCHRWTMSDSTSSGTATPPLILSADLIPALHRLGRKAPASFGSEGPDQPPEHEGSAVASPDSGTTVPPPWEDRRTATSSSRTEDHEPDTAMDQRSGAADRPDHASVSLTVEGADQAPEAATMAPGIGTEISLDYAGLATELYRLGHQTPAKLVEFMADKNSALCTDVAREVHGDEEVSEQAIRMNARRTNALLAKRGVRLSFRLVSGHVFRDGSLG